MYITQVSDMTDQAFVEKLELVFFGQIDPSLIGISAGCMYSNPAKKEFKK